MGLFWDYYLPDGRMFPDSCSRYIGGSWLNDVHRLFHDENELALRKVLLALSLTTVGLKDDKPWMVENGIKLYGSGLATLALEIETRNGQVGEGALATSKILSIYEVGFALQDDPTGADAPTNPFDRSCTATPLASRSRRRRSGPCI